MGEPSCVDKANAEAFCNGEGDSENAIALAEMAQGCIERMSSMGKRSAITMCMMGYISTSRASDKVNDCNDKSPATSIAEPEVSDSEINKDASEQNIEPNELESSTIRE